MRNNRTKPAPNQSLLAAIAAKQQAPISRTGSHATSNQHHSLIPSSQNSQKIFAPLTSLRSVSYAVASLLNEFATLATLTVSLLKSGCLAAEGVATQQAAIKRVLCESETSSTAKQEGDKTFFGCARWPALNSPTKFLNF